MQLEGQRVTISVADRGPWRPVPDDRGYRGRGLLMMTACTAEVHIEHDGEGTAVTLSSNPVPAGTGTGHRSGAEAPTG